MSILLRVWLGAVVAVLCLPVHAESLRCNGQFAEVGDSRLSVLYKCGEPLLKDTFCAPVYYYQTLDPVGEPFASTVVPCQQIDEWLYDRGQGNLMAKVRFRSGVVQSIKYGRAPH